MRHEIKTMSGVVHAGDGPGEVVVELKDGSTIVDLVVTDDAANQVVVFLDVHQVARLMMALGAAAVDL